VTDGGGGGALAPGAEVATAGGAVAVVDAVGAVAVPSVVVGDATTAVWGSGGGVPDREFR